MTQSIEGLLKNLKEAMEKKDQQRKKEPAFEQEDHPEIKMPFSDEMPIKTFVKQIIFKEVHEIMQNNPEIMQKALTEYFSKQDKGEFAALIYKFMNMPEMQGVIQSLIKNEIQRRIKELGL